MNSKKFKSAVIASALALCLMIGGISAYFTDADTATNTFTVGKVEIDLQEPTWEEPENITPEEEFAKDPKIANTGNNDAYVFIEVVVPYANVVTANEDGTRNAAADTELFTYDVKDGWVEVGTAVKNETDKTFTHLYAYAKDDVMTAVTPGNSSESVFDYIKFVNVVEDQGLEEAELNVVVNGYAIQTSNINDEATSVDGTNDDGKVSPAEVWAVISAQNADGADYTKGEEEEPTDIVK